MNRDVDFLNHLERYTFNIDEDDLLRNEEKKDACLTRLIMIGEYSSKISDKLKSRFSETEWQIINQPGIILCMFTEV
jgi:uncharacterized protein with HEPN domain